mgnify:FL=1
MEDMTKAKEGKMRTMINTQDRANTRLIAALNATLDEFPAGRGRRNSELLPRASCLAVKAGMDGETFLDAVKGVAPDMGTADIRRAYISATRVVERGTPGRCYMFPRRAPRQDAPKFKGRVRSLIAAGRDVKTPDGLVRLSQYPFMDDAGVHADTATHIRWLFHDDNDWAYIFGKNEYGATPGVIGQSIKRAGEWLSETGNPADAGELIVPNPLTGRKGETTEGKPSYIAQSCLAAYPHIIMEFDDLPIAEQCMFWAGFIRTAKLPLVCLVFSGHTSIHGCIRVDCRDALTWYAVRSKLIDLYAADEDAAFRVDPQAMRPRQGMRLAGVERKDTGESQRLLWLCHWHDDGTEVLEW